MAQCQGTTKKGKPCTRSALPGIDYCKSHARKAGVEVPRDRPASRARDGGKKSGTKYSRRVEQYKKKHGLGSTELVAAMCLMELDIIGASEHDSGKRMVWARLYLDARKQLWLEQGGEKDQTLTLYVDSAEGDSLANLLGVSGDSTGG